MSRIKPFWRVVLGSLILMVIVYNSNMLGSGGSFTGFAVFVAGFVVYIYFAIKTPYDDPLRSMRDLLAQQAAQNEADPDEDEDFVPRRRESSLVETTVRQAERITELEKELAELRARLDQKDQP